MVGSDIDTLCIVPQFIHHDDFFSDFYELLMSTPGIADLTAVRDAYVPIMKMTFHGIHIDLVFARLLMSSIPHDLKLDTNVLSETDETCVRSLNGT